MNLFVEMSSYNMGYFSSSSSSSKCQKWLVGYSLFFFLISRLCITKQHKFIAKTQQMSSNLIW